jgi:hypothetical protein
MLYTVLIVMLILMLIGAFPAWPHARTWGYGPAGGLGLIAPRIHIAMKPWDPQCREGTGFIPIVPVYRSCSFKATRGGL